MDRAFQQQLVNRELLADAPIFQRIHQYKEYNERMVREMNQGYHSADKIRAYLEQITGEKIDASVTVNTPFYTDYGRHIQFGRNVYLNINVTFVDLGGIFIKDHVLIGPGARLITVNHLTDPKKRRGLWVAPIVIKKNAWIGANATILSGVTVGENAIVAADATVTKDVPANVVVAGTPAKIVKTIA
ncbi:DapH/DapD/GlmU-related protein [Enterococcus gallinarum]|uniref:DapH/DapD/GlmU-related protein n=1 Tax=Enterococcus gallinarum TaxID=1353 RepID=UPI001BD83739|nr:sugar O-acetyltransferase [Enterococcus gallinarum]